MGCGASAPAAVEPTAAPQSSGKPDVVREAKPRQDVEKAIVKEESRNHAVHIIDHSSVETDPVAIEDVPKDESPPFVEPMGIEEEPLSEALKMPTGRKKTRKIKYMAEGTVLGEDESDVDDEEPDFFVENNSRLGSSHHDDSENMLADMDAPEKEASPPPKKRKSSKKKKKAAAASPDEISPSGRIKAKLAAGKPPEWLYRPEDHAERRSAFGISSDIEKERHLSSDFATPGVVSPQTLEESKLKPKSNKKAVVATSEVVKEDPYPTFAPNLREKEHRNEARKLYQLLNHDPFSSKHKFNDQEVADLIDECPEICSVKYEFEGFSGEIYPLSMMCALGASRKAISECIDAYPKQMQEKDEWVGTPLHYACSYHASRRVLEFLIRRDLNALSETNQFQRTPLHMACLFRAPPDCISLLLQTHATAAEKADREGMMPLHLACENGAKLAVIQELLKYNSLACKDQSQTGATPLHLAVAHKADAAVIDALVAADGSVCQIADNAQQLPLHHAIAVGADIETVRRLVEQFPDGVKHKNGRSEKPVDIAKRLKDAPKELFELLNP